MKIRVLLKLFMDCNNTIDDILNLKLTLVKILYFKVQS